ncbi:MAG: bifunctional folylpolyglutamate synthase/dihydrofolate synthase [Prevotella sp.]|nr:bifunctional folylpolyglutamate synthase/dihydrofolate synthase [Prevotella sp.]
MTYKETTEYLFNVTPVFEKVGATAYKEGLSNSLALDEHFGFPHRKFKTIHVAGTNGKGSCSHTLAAILQSAGYKVGLYTSPHLVDFRERIRVNGLCISEERVVEFVEKEKHFFEPLHPSFFELTTAMAFLYFAEQKVDVAVIEVGLGGRLDCTNIITPELCVITNISFDHTQFLGSTLAEIAAEKAGIIKIGVPVVIGETTDETRPVFERIANEKHAPIHFAEAFDTSSFDDFDFELKGSYQQANRRTILCAASLLDIDKEAIREGLSSVCEKTGLIGRWQTLQEKPLVICDTGHNLGGWEYLSKQIASQPCKKLRIVFGMVDDKDIDSVMDLLPKTAIYYWTQASSHRAIPHSVVRKKGKEHGLIGKSFKDVSSAYSQALTDASPEDFIFVGGSSYVVADLLAIGTE